MTFVIVLIKNIILLAKTRTFQEQLLQVKNTPVIVLVSKKNSFSYHPIFTCHNRPSKGFHSSQGCSNTHDLVRAFKSVILCCPVQVQNLHPNAASLAELRKFSFLNNDATIDGLVNELPRYLAAADGTVIEEEEEKVQWWAKHARTLPNWSAVVRKLLLVQPS